MTKLSTMHVLDLADIRDTVRLLCYDPNEPLPINRSKALLVGSLRNLANGYSIKSFEVGVTDISYPVGNVKRYGATGDSITNDTVAFQNALASLSKNANSQAYVPDGIYRVTSSLVPPSVSAFINSSNYSILLGGGAKVLYTGAPGTSLFNLSSTYGQQGSFTIIGGVLQGDAVSNQFGVNLHKGNVILERVVIQYFKGAGVTYTYDADNNYPICSTIRNCLIQLNKVGILSAVSMSGFVVDACRIEGNDEEGINLTNVGKVSVVNSVLENNGRVDTTKSEMHFKDGVCFNVTGCYFESTAYQDHILVLIEANAIPGLGGVFTGNILVGYYETFFGSGVALANSVGLDIAGGAGGVVETVMAFGNYYAGMLIGCRVNTNARGFVVGPDNFSDNFNPAFVTPACSRYVRNSSNAGIIYDMNRYSHAMKLNGSIRKRLTQTVYSAAITPDANFSNHIMISANNGTAFTINAPINPPAANEEQEIEFAIRNQSGGALGAVTWNALYRLAGAWVSPANGFYRAIRFKYNGAAWYEMSRTTADAAN